LKQLSGSGLRLHQKATTDAGEKQLTGGLMSAQPTPAHRRRD
jgi:hypothetical protein